MVCQLTRSLHEILTWLVITENGVFSVFSNNQPCQYFMERTGCLANQRYIINFWFLMENSILKIFGSVDVKKSPLTSVHNYNQLPEGGLTFKPSGRGSVTTAAVVFVSFLKEPVNIKKSRISPWYKRIRKAAVVQRLTFLELRWIFSQKSVSVLNWRNVARPKTRK